MPVSESRRRANDKWDKENMATLTCKLKKVDADKFRERARAGGETANAVLVKLVKNYIADDDQQEKPP